MKTDGSWQSDQGEAAKPRLTARAAAFGVAYIALWSISWALATSIPTGSGASLWHPTAGLTMALLVTFGRRAVPLAFAGCLIGMLVAGKAPLSGQSVADALVASATAVAVYALTAWVLTAVADFNRRFTSMRSAVYFMAAMPLAATATALAAALPLPLTLAPGNTPGGVVDLWLGWWLGEVLGLLTVTPLLLIHGAPLVQDWLNRRPLRLNSGTRRPERTTRSRAGRIAVLSAIIIGGGAVLAAAGLPYSQVAHSRIDSAGPEYDLGFLLFLPLIWTGIRFGIQGVVIAIPALTVAMAAALALMQGSVDSGPFQLLIGSVAAMGLALGAAVSARNDALTGLEHARRTLERRVEARTRDLRQEVERRTRAEQQARSAQTAAEASCSAKTTALSQMTHEFRTPLNAIIGFSDMMRNEILGPLGDAKYQQYASHVHSSGRHLLSMLNAIIDVSSAEADTMTVETVPIDLNALMVEAVNLLRPESENKSVTVSVGQTGPTTIIGDECRVRQILLNLLSNAIKYTPKGGAVHTSLSVTAEDRIRLTVRDTGQGIAPDDLPHLGQPFFRGHNPERLQARGTGIGLTVVYQYARLHGATVSYDSEVGRGTTVTVDFPDPQGPAANGLAGSGGGTANDPTKSQPAAGAIASGEPLKAETG